MPTAIALVLLVSCCTLLKASETTEEVVARMMEADARATPQLRAYTSLRRYTLENRRFGRKAEITVRARFRYPGLKEFEVLAGSGSATIRKRVFLRMLAAETEASRDEMRVAAQITPRNYEFRLLGSEERQAGKWFVLEVTPKAKSKYLFRGRIWVDGQDYAIARIEGKPAQNPSVWIRRTTFVHQYAKVGSFWLPASNVSSSDVAIFGTTEVRVEYFGYEVNQGGELARPAAVGQQ